MHERKFQHRAYVMMMMMMRMRMLVTACVSQGMNAVDVIERVDR
jgi:hypothetical protein